MPSRHGPRVEAFYHSTLWRKCREAKLRQCHYVCERCGKPNVIIHHKVPLNETNVDDPSIALSLDNLEALCIECHNREHYASSPGRVIRFSKNGDVIAAED